jgi:hypothetical protein
MGCLLGSDPQAGWEEISGSGIVPSAISPNWALNVDVLEHPGFAIQWVNATQTKWVIQKG